MTEQEHPIRYEIPITDPIQWVADYLQWLSTIPASPDKERRLSAFHYYMQFGAERVLDRLNVRVEVVHPERFDPTRPRLLVANHTSLLNVPTLLRCFPGPLRFTAKKQVGELDELKSLGPIIMRFLEDHGYPLDWDNARQMATTMSKAAVEMVEDGSSVGLFPEGRCNQSIGPFKSEAFRIAYRAQCELQPVALIETYQASGLTVTVCVGEPVKATGGDTPKGRSDLSDLMRESIIALGAPA